MKRPILTPRDGQIATATRLAFEAALAVTPEHTKVTGKVFRALTTPAGFTQPKRGA